MKAVMISIKPEWCELIANGQKTIEVRKTKPKLKPPFKCYIYQTVGRRINTVDVLENNLGKVIGEFVCDGFYTMKHCGYDNRDIKLRLVNEDLHYLEINSDFLNKCQLSYYNIEKYSNGKPLFGWHISDLVIYDEPKELSEFYNYDTTYNNAFGWAFSEEEKRTYLKRPPQSWCYVEEIEI